MPTATNISTSYAPGGRTYLAIAIDFTRGLLGARDRGAMYPILTDGDANLTEGSGFNVILIKDGKLYTPNKGVLEGVTRKSVLAVAETLGYPHTIDDVPVDLA